jgi:hypothetical protein
MTTALLPDFLADVDAEERSELETLLGTSLELPPSGDQLAIDAMASRYLRAMAAIERDITHERSLEALEIAMVQDAHAPRVAKLSARYATLERVVCHLAAVSDFGSKKSARLAFGEFGRRAKKAAVKIIDEAIALAWARANAPSLVERKTVEKLPHANVAKWFGETGELPEGCEFIPERDEPFAKPAALPGGVR